MYKNSGLAEIVRNPSQTTVQYLNLWFKGSGAYGKAMTLLGWPVHKSDQPLFAWNKDDGLRVDLREEEKVLYSNTLLHYVKNQDDYQLAIDFKRIFSLKKIVGTIRVIWSQSKLLVNYQNTYDLGKSYVESIPLTTPENRKLLEDQLSDRVWPMVIATDYMSEFIYSALTNNLSKEQKSKLIAKLHEKTRLRDWYTKSILAWSEINEKNISEKEFLLNYGYASGDGYELTTPRYYELLKKPKPEIRDIEIEHMEVKSLEDLYVGLQYLRSEAKRRSLVWIASLREMI